MIDFPCFTFEAYQPPLPSSRRGFPQLVHHSSLCYEGAPSTRPPHRHRVPLSHLYQGCDMGTRHEDRDNYGLVLAGKFGGVFLWYVCPINSFRDRVSDFDI